MEIDPEKERVFLEYEKGIKEFLVDNFPDCFIIDDHIELLTSKKCFDFHYNFLKKWLKK